MSACCSLHSARILKGLKLNPMPVLALKYIFFGNIKPVMNRLSPVK